MTTTKTLALTPKVTITIIIVLVLLFIIFIQQNYLTIYKGYSWRLTMSDRVAVLNVCN